MKFVKCILVLLIAALLIPAIACDSGEAEPTPTPSPTATPTPTPVPTLPDLTITNVTFDPAIGCEGAPVQVSVTIENQGTLLSPACYWSWQLYGGSDPVIISLTSLPPGGSIVAHTEMELAEDITGTFNTTSIVDAMSGVSEIDEDNNEFNTQFTIAVCDFEASYNSDKSAIQTALDAYKASHNGSMPVTSNSAQINLPAGTYSILDICALIGEGELLDEVPDSCLDGSFDNCAAGTCGCAQDAHYIWLVNPAGNVLSTCVGGDCIDNFTDGYQGIWP